MKNRWSDAARAASLAVRKHRAFAPAPGTPITTPGRLPPKPMAPKPTAPKTPAGGAVTKIFYEATGTRGNPIAIKSKPVTTVPYATDREVGNPGKHIWIPPPSSPLWNDPEFVASFKKGVADQKKASLATGTFSTKPNIFYSSTYPNGPGQEGTQGILRYDPKKPLDASKLGYNVPKKTGGTQTPYSPGAEGSRVVIGGKIYLRVGNKMVPYRTSAAT